MKRHNVASISVIVPCFCCSDTIQKTIYSVLNQTLLPREIIMINDGSNDGGKTKKKLSLIKNHIESNYKKTQIKIINLQKNYGPSYVRNKAWNLSSQKYIAFIDDDDLWHKDKIKTQYNWMQNHKQLSFTAHKSEYYSKPIKKNKLDYINYKIISVNQLLFKNFFPTRTVMLKRNINFRFDELKRYGEDYDLWLRISKDYSLVFMDIVLSYSLRLDYSKGGLSGNLINMQVSELKTILSNSFKQKLNPIISFMALIYSNIKFIRRLIIIILR